MSWFRQTKRSTDIETAAYGYASKLYRMAYARLGNAHDAEDVVQETYLKAFRAIESFQPGSNLQSWLAQILVNTIRDHVRRLTRSVSTISLEGFEEPGIDFEVAECSAGPEQELIENELDADLVRALRSTPEWLLTPLLLREFHELTYKEIASVLDLPVGTVMSRLSRARQHLRQKLDVSAAKATDNQPECHADKPDMDVTEKEVQP